MFQAMFKANTQGLEDECSIAGMKDLVLHHAPSASFGFLMLILALCVRRHINDITTMMASLREAETWQQQKGVWMVSQAPSVLQVKSDPVQVTRTQMW